LRDIKAVSEPEKKADRDRIKIKLKMIVKSMEVVSDHAIMRVPEPTIKRERSR
jgi:hypothetical protein